MDQHMMDEIKKIVEQSIMMNSQELTRLISTKCNEINENINKKHAERSLQLKLVEEIAKSANEMGEENKKT